MFKSKEQENELKQLLTTLFQNVADLNNPYKFDIGDKVTAHNTQFNIEYVGDIVSRSYQYHTIITEHGVLPQTRINSFSVYNTRTKTAHNISDEVFTIEHRQ